MEKDVLTGDFEKEVLKSDLPVLVDFWASWCAPCLAAAPAVSHIAKHYEGKLKVCKVNVDEAGDVAQKYMIQSIPTFIVFKNGAEAERMVGMLDKRHLEDTVRQHIGC
jgi:thioredoxin 1